MLQRLEPRTWADRLWPETDDRIVLEGIVALCKTGQAAAFAGPLFERLTRTTLSDRVSLVDYLRTVQLALIHTRQRAPEKLVKRLSAQFPHTDRSANRELAILLTHWSQTRLVEPVVHSRLLSALEAAGEDREQQIHYFLCLRLLRHEHWSPEERRSLLSWYAAVRGGEGGGSYLPFLEAIFAEMAPLFTDEERRSIANREAKPTPKETPARVSTERKLTFDELLAFLDGGGMKRGDAERGRRVFEKADCLRCHRHGNAGGGTGPDLTTLARRFTRRTMLEAIVYPSKDISDQYRAMVLVTTRGTTHVGQVSARGEMLSVHQCDGRVITLRKKDIEEQYPSPLSLMPEGLLDGLSKEEIADLFAFLESSL